MKGFAWELVLKQRHSVTQKWPNIKLLPSYAFIFFSFDFTVL